MPAPFRRLFGTLPRLRQSALARNASVLYLAHFVGLAVPLVTIPYLARVLRPEGWGAVIFAQSLGAWMSLVAEYGFDLSGTREVARRRADGGALPDIVASIQGAKLLVSLPLHLVALVAWATVPTFRAHPALVLWAWAYALCRGLLPSWFFFGQERMRLPALVETGARVLAAGSVFIWVHGPEHGWRVIALQAVTTAAALLWLTVGMYREVPFRRPRAGRSLAMLRASAGVFAFRSASGLYLQANAFVLGLLASPQAVAFFGGVEKLVRGGINLFHPLSQALFPRLAHLTVHDDARASGMLRIGIYLLGGLGVGLGLVMFGGARPIVSLLLGPGYEAAVPVLRTMAFLPPVIAVGTVFGIQWALPAGLERPFYRLVITAGAVNLALALLLVPGRGALGMAFSVLVAETVVAGGLVLVFLARGGSLRPLRIPAAEPPASAPIAQTVPAPQRGADDSFPPPRPR